LRILVGERLDHDRTVTRHVTLVKIYFPEFVLADCSKPCAASCRCNPLIAGKGIKARRPIRQSRKISFVSPKSCGNLSFELIAGMKGDG
jgi:hypothetical protein